MKYIIDGRSIVNKTTGISRYSIELLKGYIRRYGADNVSVILMNNISLGLCHEIHTSLNRYKIFDTIKFSFMLYKLKYDVYHSGDLIGPIFKRKGTIHILTVHDLMYLIVPSFLGKPTFQKKLRILKSKIIDILKLQASDKIISISKTTSVDLKRLMGFDSSILREGINLLSNSNKQDYIRDNFKELHSNGYFLYVGLGYPHKNIKFMIDAFLNAKTEKKLVICGKEHPLAKNQYKNVIFTGWVNDNELDYLYKNCAAFVFPSLYEGFGLPILEALSYGKKVLSSNAGSLSEFSSEFVNFFNPYKIKELSTLMEKIDEININEKKLSMYLEYFSWEKIWDEFHNEFHNEFNNIIK